MQVDVLIAGGGIAGLLLARALRWRGRSVLLADDPAHPAAAHAAVGLLNPVLGQRLTLAWQAAVALPFARAVYAEIGRETETSLLHDVPIVRVLQNERERAAWHAHGATISAAGFAIESTASIPRGFAACDRDAITIHGGGSVDVAALLEVLRRQFRDAGALVEQPCRSHELVLSANGVRWTAANVEARTVVLAGGAADLRAGGNVTYYVTNRSGHPLPIRPVKGESLLIRAALPEQVVFVRGHFLAPRGGDRWICGATVGPGVDDAIPSASGRRELEDFLQDHVSVPWALENHRAGVRATTPDLRPLVGRYLQPAPVFVFNGLGSRGVALGPWLADLLAAHIVDGAPLPREILPERFAPVPPDSGRWHAVDVARTEALLRVQPGDAVIDLTVGNGGDTLWLAEAVGRGGRVWGFDVQAVAIANAWRRMETAEVEADVRLHEADHARVAEIVPARDHGRIAVAVANLGHLPGSDSPVITRSETTLAAFAATLPLLRVGGALTAVVYTGHAGGAEELAAIEHWVARLDPSAWSVRWERSPTRIRHAPVVLLIERQR